MSLALSLAPSRAGRWRFAAHSMEECLDEAIRTRRVGPEVVPSRLVNSVRTLLMSALNAEASSPGLDDPSAAISAYRLAADALRSVDPEIEHESVRLTQALQSYADFLTTLATARQLQDAEVEQVRALRTFFSSVFRAADAEDYEATMADEFRSAP
jgi:hypothetical protein